MLLLASGLYQLRDCPHSQSSSQAVFWWNLTSTGEAKWYCPHDQYVPQFLVAPFRQQLPSHSSSCRSYRSYYQTLVDSYSWGSWLVSPCLATKSSKGDDNLSQLKLSNFSRPSRSVLDGTSYQPSRNCPSVQNSCLTCRRPGYKPHR